MKGMKRRDNATGTWYLGYASGKKEGVFTYGEGEALLTAEVWYDNGTKFCEGNRGTIVAPDPYNQVEKKIDVFTATFWDSSGRKACVDKNDAEGNMEDLILYWPDGGEAFEKFCQKAGLCNVGYFQMTDLEGRFLFHIDEEGLKGGYGNNSHCGISMEIQGSDSGTTKTIPDGPITLMSFGNVQDILGSPNPDLLQYTTPLVTAKVKNGRLSGTLTIAPVTGMGGSFHFKKGILDGPTELQDLYIHDYQFKNGKLVKEKDSEADMIWY
jgi:hypothetical protein